MATSYGLIIRRLSRTLKKRGTDHLSSSTQQEASKYDQSQRTSSKPDNKRRRITWMCASLVISFVFLWLPFHVGHLAKLTGIPLPMEKIQFENQSSTKMFLSKHVSYNKNRIASFAECMEWACADAIPKYLLF